MFSASRHCIAGWNQTDKTIERVDIQIDVAARSPGPKMQCPGRRGGEGEARMLVSRCRGLVSQGVRGYVKLFASTTGQLLVKSVYNCIDL